jgi:GNAT superfamily N-acetyltransferase
MQITISETPSADLKNLFWNIFFISKNRGISLKRHFPWLENRSCDVVFFEATVSSVAIGGLVLRKKKYLIEDKEIKIGMIGLVCVASENRGVGVAAALLTKTIAYADSQSYDFLTLWTSQHHIYATKQFYVTDPWLYGWIHTDKCAKRLDNYKYLDKKTISEIKLAPLPPFATAAFEYSSGSLSFTLLKDKDGDIVVEYKGNVADLGLFMIQTLPERWRLNVVKNDPLISVLINYAADVKLTAVDLQMWLDLREPHQQASIIERITIPVLDRI